MRAAAGDNAGGEDGERGRGAIGRRDAGEHPPVDCLSEGGLGVGLSANGERELDCLTSRGNRRRGRAIPRGRFLIRAEELADVLPLLRFPI